MTLAVPTAPLGRSRGPQEGAARVAPTTPSTAANRSRGADALVAPRKLGVRLAPSGTRRPRARWQRSRAPPSAPLGEARAPAS
eukprot:1512324-Lingulodinium_polyedra.AAC.1